MAPTFGGRRGDVDDAAPFPLHHAGQAELGGAIGARQIDIDDSVPKRVGMIDHAVPGRGAGGIDQDVDLAMAFQHRPEEVINRFERSDIERQGRRPHAAGRDLLPRPLHLFRRQQIDGLLLHHLRPLAFHQRADGDLGACFP